MIWLEIDSAPSVACYREQAARSQASGDLLLPVLTSVGTLRRPLSIPGYEAAENANVVVSLDNGDGRMTRLWAHDPPVRAVARLMSDAGELFAGVVTGITLGARATVSIEAGLVRPLTDTVPLRSATVWGDFSRAETLPIVYGRVTLAAVRYTATRYLVADHPIVGVDSVRVDGETRADWRHRNALDSTGRAVAFVEFVDPVDASAEVSVSLRGRPHPATGALMTAPDEILWDVLANVCGLDITPAQLDALRVESVGIEIGGVLDHRTRTVRAQVDMIVEAIGGAWSAGADGVAMLFPLVDYGDRPTDLVVDRISAADIEADTTHGGLANVVRLEYAYDWSTGEPTASIEVEDDESIRLYGRIEVTRQAHWLHSERQADALARRWLAWMATPKWRMTWRCADIDLRPGDWADIDHPASPISGRHRILSVDADYDALTAIVTVEALRESATVTYPPPSGVSIRITEGGDTRITESGDTRILES